MERASCKGTEGSRGTVPGYATDCPQPGAVLCDSGLKYVFTSRRQSEAEAMEDRERVCKYYGIQDDASKSPGEVYVESHGQWLDWIIHQYNREHNMA